MGCFGMNPGRNDGLKTDGDLRTVLMRKMLPMWAENDGGTAAEWWPALVT